MADVLTTTATATETLLSTVTRTISGTSTATSTNRAPSQGGILEGSNPVHWNPRDPIVLFIIQAGIIIIFCRLLHFPLSRIRQPRVIAEVIGGILLGPSVMGRIPGFTSAIFPTESMPALSLAANLGLVLFLFLVGLEVDLRFLVSNWKIALSVGALGMALPFGLGAAIAYGLYHEFSDEPGTQPISFGVFLLFIGVAMAITAFPVLCRILTELKLLGTPVGVIVLSAGVGNDVVGWILLALCVALVNAGTGLTALWVLLVAIGWTLFLVYAVKPALRWVCQRTGSLENGPTQGVVALVILMVLVSSFFTNIIGVHAIFGAFMVGLICPHESGFAVKLTEKIEDLVSVLLLPLYFALSGLNTNLGLLNNGITWGYVIGVIAIAFIAKIAGGTIAARANGLVWRESFTIGALMSCKGLVELIVLNIGLQARILSRRTFTIFVVMALVTTFATTPLVKTLYPHWYQVKLSAWKRGEIDWEGNRLDGNNGDSSDEGSSTHKTEPREIRKVVAYLRLDNISGVMALCSLIAEPAPRTSAPKFHPSKKEAHTEDEDSPDHKRPLQVHGVRLTELTDRGSSVMRVAEADEYTLRDPVVNTFRAFGQLRNVNVSGALLISSEDTFSATLAERAEAANADLLLIPWSQDGTMNDSFSPATLERSSDRFEANYAPFVAQAVYDAPCTTAVLVDNGLGGTRRRAQRPNTGLKRTVSSLSARSIETPVTTGSAYVSAGHHVFLPFFGSNDDVQALRFVLQMAKDPAVTATIVRYEIPEHQLVSATTGEIEPASPIEGPRTPKSPSTPTMSRSWTREKDAVTTTAVKERSKKTAADYASLFNALADSLPGNMLPRVAFETVRWVEGSEATILQTVVGKAKEECGQVARGAGDLVVFGRNRRLRIPGQEEGDSRTWLDGEAGRTLGAIAGAICRGGVNASWVAIEGK